MTDDRSNKLQLLAVRMSLAALKDDLTAQSAVWDDVLAMREADFEANGMSDVFPRLTYILAASAAGAALDLEESRGRGIEGAERFYLRWIQQLLDEASA